MAGNTGGKSPVNITHSLAGVHFPCNKTDLLHHAKQQHADADVLEALEDLPEGEYGSMADVMKGYGEEHQHTR